MDARFRDVGEGGLMVELGSAIREETGALVAALHNHILKLSPEGLLNSVPAYASLLLLFDPLRTDVDELKAIARAYLQESRETSSSGGKTVDIPVCYGGDYGEDLPFVAKRAGLSEGEVIRIHAETLYRVYMIGFLPGFPYLGGLDARLHTPRLEAPRTSIPAGSVGIGGQQTGIYPIASPGGWRLIGRTPLDLSPTGHVPYAPGDRVRFVPISEREFARLAGKEDRGWR